MHALKQRTTSRRCSQVKQSCRSRAARGASAPTHLEAAHHLAQVRARQLNIQLQAVLLLCSVKGGRGGAKVALGCEPQDVHASMHKLGGMAVSARSLPTTNPN